MKPFLAHGVTFHKRYSAAWKGLQAYFSAKKMLLVHAEEPTRPLQVVTSRCNGIVQILDVIKPKTSLKNCIHTVSNFISFNLSNVGEYSEDKVEMRKDHLQVQKKKKKFFFCWVHVLHKWALEIRKFQVVVVQRRLGNVQKNMMHAPS